MRARLAIAAVGLAALIGVAAADRAQLDSARSARDIIAEKLEPRRDRARGRLLALYRSSSVARSIFDPEHRWRRARARADLIRVLRRDLAELDALETELSWVRDAASDLGGPTPEAPRPAVLRPVVNAPVVSGFGPYEVSRRVRAVRSGVVLETTSNASIRAPVAGRIVYSGEVAGLGQAAVIESDGHWITMGPLALERALGSEVTTGERIGRTAGTRLRLELRRIDSRGGAPIDPRPLGD